MHRGDFVETVNVARLKASLSQYLAKVKAGEEVVVTDRGKAVARLLPIEFPPDFPEQFQRLVAAGKLRVPRRWPDQAWVEEFWKLPRGKDPEGLVLKALLEEREEGW